MSCVISILIRTNYNSNYVIQISFFVISQYRIYITKRVRCASNNIPGKIWNSVRQDFQVE